MSINENSNLLSYSTNLNAGQIYTSTSENTTQYASITTIVNSDVNLNIKIQFSTDNINWDSEHLYIYYQNNKSVYETKIDAIYCRIIIENISLVTSTIIRVNTNGCIIPTIITTKPEQGFIQKINTRTDDFNVNLNEPLHSSIIYDLAQCQNVVIPTQFTTALISAYEFILSASSPANAYYSTPNNCLALNGMNGIIGDYEAIIGTHSYTYNPGQPMYLRMGCYFQAVTLNLSHIQEIGYGIKQNLGSADIYTGVFLTWNDDDKFGISKYYNNIRTVDTQEFFNIDKLDGSGPSKMIIDPHSLNIFEIDLSYLGVGTITFKILNPLDGQLISFHQLQLSNTSVINQLSTAHGTFLMHQIKTTANPNGGNFYGAVCSHWEIISSKHKILDTRVLELPFAGLSPGPNNILAYLQNRTLFLNNTVRINSLLKLINCSIVPSAGTTAKVAVIRIYENTVFTGPVWQDILGLYTPIQYSTVGTLTTLGKLILSVSVVDGTPIICPSHCIQLKSNKFYAITIQILTSGSNSDGIVSIVWSDDI